MTESQKKNLFTVLHKMKSFLNYNYSQIGFNGHNNGSKIKVNACSNAKNSIPLCGVGPSADDGTVNFDPFKLLPLMAPVPPEGSPLGKSSGPFCPPPLHERDKYISTKSIKG